VLPVNRRMTVPDIHQSRVKGTDVVRQLRRTLLAATVVMLAAAGVAVGARVALADTTLCDQYASTTAGQYVVQNNRWGTSATQCINVTSNGFRITQQAGSSSTSGAPVSYPSIFYGCHYTNCSPGTVLPRQISAMGSVTSSISYSYVGNATYDAAYDIWMDPSPKKDGVNQTEIMIWFNHVGQVQPVGSSRGGVSVAGRDWTVWTGNNGGNNVVSYVAPSAIGSWSFDVLAFARDTIARGFGTASWYLTSVQAGFEPWQGGVGLAVNSFSVAVNGSGGGGGGGGGGTSASPTTGGGGGGGGGSSACQITYATNPWTGGFTANVTIKNSGSSSLSSWGLAFTLPSGQTITSSWNTALSGNSGSITARNVNYNASIPPGGSQSFGFQGTYSGSFARPSSFSLNGTNCSIA